MEWYIIPTGRVWVEPGGAMGLVPRPLWIEHQPVDQQQRTPMDLNSLLVLTGKHKILIDTGLGHKLSEKGEKNWGLEWPEGDLVGNLDKLGFAPQDIDIVINTHLHSDHCGGNTYLNREENQLTFPNAQYYVQRLEFADAYNPDARTSGTYLSENFVPVWQQGRFNFFYGDTEITQGLQAVLTRGHTRGHQCLVLSPKNEPPVLFLSDLSSYSVHFAKTAWVTAYDVEPLETIRTKMRWQAWALENDATLVFQHDTHIRTGKLITNDKGRYEIKTLSPGSYILPA